jgi:hypothetical protein
MRLSILTTAIVLLAACNQVNPISEEEKVEIDCLSSITVVKITDAIREGTENGIDAKELQKIPGEKIAEAIEILDTKYDGRMDEAFLEYEINHRLDKIQDALNNRDPDSDANKIMTETLELGRSCTFGS